MSDDESDDNEYDVDVPRVISIDDNQPSVEGSPNHSWHHLDEIEQIDPDATDLVHIYVFEHEDRVEDLDKTIHALRQDYVFARGVVWPDELDGVIQECSDAVLADMEWLLVTGMWDGDTVRGDDLVDAVEELRSRYDEK